VIGAVRPVLHAAPAAHARRGSDGKRAGNVADVPGPGGEIGRDAREARRTGAVQRGVCYEAVSVGGRRDGGQAG